MRLATGSVRAAALSESGDTRSELPMRYPPCAPERLSPAVIETGKEAEQGR